MDGDSWILEALVGFALGTIAGQLFAAFLARRNAKAIRREDRKENRFDQIEQCLFRILYTAARWPSHLRHPSRTRGATPAIEVGWKEVQEEIDQMKDVVVLGLGHTLEPELQSRISDLVKEGTAIGDTLTAYGEERPAADRASDFVSEITDLLRTLRAEKS